MRSTLLARVSRQPTGTVAMTFLAAAPTDTLLLNGQLVARVSYPVLWQWVQDNSLIGTGRFTVGDGSTTFGVPDLRGRVPIGVGTLGSNTYTLGQASGAATVSLTTSQMPAHNHGAHSHWVDMNHGGHHPTDSVSVAGGGTYGVSPWNAGGTSSGSLASDSSNAGTEGSATPVDVRQPSLGVNWVVWT